MEDETRQTNETADNEEKIDDMKNAAEIFNSIDYAELLQPLLRIQKSADGLDELTGETKDEVKQHRKEKLDPLQKIINMTFENLQNGVVENDFLELENQDSKNIMSAISERQIDNTINFVDEVNGKLQAAIDAEDPEEKNRLYLEARESATDKGYILAEESLKNISVLINAMPKETQDALRDFGVYTLFNNLFSNVLQSDAGDIENIENSLIDFEEIMRAVSGAPAEPQGLAETFYIPHDPITQNVKKYVNEGEQIIKIPYKNTTIKESFIATSVISEMDGVKINGYFGPDEELASAVLITMWLKGYRKFSPEQFCREYTRNNKLNPSAKQKEDLSNWINTLNNTNVSYDFTEWAQKTIDPEITNTVYDMLPLMAIGRRSIKRKSGKKEVEYFFREEPLILQYAEMTGQLWAIPDEYREIKKINSKGELSKTRETISNRRNRILYYLLQRALLYRHKREEARDKYNKYAMTQKKKKLPVDKTYNDFLSHYDEILFTTLFKETRLEDSTNAQLVKDKDFIFTVLTNWKGKLFDDFKVIDGSRKNSPKGIRLI